MSPLLLRPSREYDFRAFLAEHRGESRHEILRAIEHELIRVSYKLRGKARSRARAGGAEGYRRALARAAQWLRRAEAIGRRAVDVTAARARSR